MKVLIKLFCLICKLTITVAKQVWVKIYSNQTTHSKAIINSCNYSYDKVET